MSKVMLKECTLANESLKDVISIAVFGSYHEDVFHKDRSDIDIMILTQRELEIDEEFDIEDYLQGILPQYFNHSNIHYTFISEFNYPFSELLLISKDKIIFDEELYLEYVLGYSAFKRDRESLEIMREENLRDLEAYRNGLL
ncbi:nucleotidyltransferase domain-containing protein [Clostridium sp.]|uniref:nucleotidyltransferase domain-containing protein n=1 Tax=Clostridium sp. TaxID=1506 RepID=UPI003F397440